jgi:hypothetical protein
MKGSSSKFVSKIDEVLSELFGKTNPLELNI